MNMDNAGGLTMEVRGWAGWRRVKGEYWDNCNSINNKTLKSTKNKINKRRKT